MLKKSLSINNAKKFIFGIDKKILLNNGKKVRYINFDNAASTPSLTPVVDKVTEFLNWYSSIHRGTGYKSKISTNIYEEAREIVSNFVKSDSTKNTVIFVKNTTEAINKLSYRLDLSKDDIVISSLMEHHSNDLPWRKKAKTLYINLLKDGRLNLNDLEDKLKKYKNKVKLVTVTGASNVTGYINDIHTIASLSHRYGAKIMVDCAQLAPHREINMKGYKDDDYIDFIAFSAHKIYAPFGTGVLIGPKSIFYKGEPEYVGGGTILSVTKYNSYWSDLPDKEEAGTPNVVGAVALSSSLNFIKNLGMENIERQEKKLTTHILNKITKIPGLNIYSLPKQNSIDDMVGVISFKAEHIPHNLLASTLAYEGGIGVRSGCFCAHPYVHNLLNLSQREISKLQQDLIFGRIKNTPGLVRVSFGLYNTISEIDTFISILEEIVLNKDKYIKKYRYNANTGEYTPIKINKGMFKEFSLKY